MTLLFAKSIVHFFRTQQQKQGQSIVISKVISEVRRFRTVTRKTEY